MINFLFYITRVSIHIHVIGGSSYIGGCNAAYPITYLPGVTGTTSTETMPGGSTRSDYISGVGVGKVGLYATLQSPGGNGAIVLTITSTTASPSTSPSFSPSTSVPSSKTPSLVPTFFPTTKTPTSSPSAAPSTIAPTSSTPLTYSTPGTYTVMIPADSSGVTMSMWGAGGAGTGIKNMPSSNAIMYPGGSGAFVSCTINAIPGSTIYLLVGGGGAVGNYIYIYVFSHQLLIYQM